MGFEIIRVFSRLFGSSQEARILMVGLDAAGMSRDV